MTSPPPPQPEPAAIDPRLDAMLDQALAPKSAPAGLVQRVVARTSPRLPRAGGRRSVLARLGPPLRLAAAVGLLIVAGLGVWMFKVAAPPPTSTRVDMSAVDAMAFSDTPMLRDGTDRLTALVIVTQTSDLVGRAPVSLDEATVWSRSDPLAF